MKKKIKRIAAIFYAVIMLQSTFYHLGMSASAAEPNEGATLICQQAEHVHSEQCEETISTLICDIQESVGHVHGDDCYSTELTCDIETDENGDVHEHSENCYTSTLVCEIAEGEDAHSHNQECYETRTILVCNMAEHTHVETCYESVNTPTIDGIKTVLSQFFVLITGNEPVGSEGDGTESNEGGVNQDPEYFEATGTGYLYYYLYDENGNLVTDENGNPVAAEYTLPYEYVEDGAYDIGSRPLHGYTGDVSKYIYIDPIITDEIQGKLAEDEEIFWYVAKSENNGVHVDGRVVKKVYTIDVRYVSGDELLGTTLFTVTYGTKYDIEVASFEGYTTDYRQEDYTGFIAKESKSYVIPYTVVPSTPVTPPTTPEEPVTPPAEEPAPTPVVVQTPAPTPVVVEEPVVETPVVEEIPVDEPQIEVTEEVVGTSEVNIEDNNTPLANVSGEALDILDDETPLANMGHNCWIHWLVLLGSVVYVIYTVIRGYFNNKKIKALNKIVTAVDADKAE